MPIAPPTMPVNGTISQALFPVEVNSKFFKEWVEILALYNFMGTELGNIIVLHDMQDGEGWTYTISKSNALDHTKRVFDFDQVRGSAQRQKWDSMLVNTRRMSTAAELKGRDLIKQGTPVQILSELQPRLVEASQLALNNDLLDAAMTGQYDTATQLPSFDRIVLGSTAAGTITRATYDGYAGIQTALAAVTGAPDYTGDGLSARHLMRIKRYALQGGANSKVEDKIRPANITTKGGFPVHDYVMLCHPAAIDQLYSDPIFFTSTAARGVVLDKENQPNTLYGADYVGKFKGIHLYEAHDLADYEITVGGATYAWNLLLGGGAWTLGWYEEPSIVCEYDNIDSYQLCVSHETRGQESCKFPAKLASTLTAAANGHINPLVEQGIMHSFVKIA